MLYDYDRKSFCLIRWVAYLAGILFILSGAGRIGILVIGGAFLLTRVGAKWDLSLARRYKWYGIAWISYYLILLIYVIMIKGQVFDIPGFELFFVVPFIPEVILYEVKEYRGR